MDRLARAILLDATAVAIAPGVVLAAIRGSGGIAAPPGGRARQYMAALRGTP
jgi:hypothetical protein